MRRLPTLAVRIARCARALRARRRGAARDRSVEHRQRAEPVRARLRRSRRGVRQQRQLPQRRGRAASGGRSDGRRHARGGLAAGPLERRWSAWQRARVLERRRRDVDRELAAVLPLAGGTATSAVQATTGAPRPSDYQRATDPWVSYGPDGRLHAIALVFDNSTPRNAILTAFSDDDGATWSAPREVRFDNPRALGNNFNDKETLTADPGDPDLVYATWQRIVSPSERASGTAYENSVSFFSDTWFARSTDGGETWEPARAIFHPRQVPADDRQPDRGAARRHADQRVQPDPGGQQPQLPARLQRRAAPLARQG